MRLVHARIVRIWVVWALGMAVVIALTWTMFQVPLPGFSSGTPGISDILAYLAFIGPAQAAAVGGIVFGPPIILTWYELWKDRNGW